MGAGMFTCADIIVTDDESEVPEVNEGNCFNSTSIRVSDVAILGSLELPSARARLGSSPDTEPTSRVVGPGSGDDSWGWAGDGNNRSELFGSSGSSSGGPSATQSPPADNGARGVTGGIREAMAAAFPLSVIFAVLPAVFG
ncbi:hypothetical protein VTG60DRAFT_1207 [Thermothelomyces hinnuleus]